MDTSPSPRDHMEGFEREARFNLIFMRARRDCPVLMVPTVKRIIAQAAPAFTEGLFERRPCVRSLRFIGTDEDPFSTGLRHFSPGAVYRSTNFNGATYTVEGDDGGNHVIGYVYFEWVDHE